jgi:hypothetical protein
MPLVISHYIISTKLYLYALKISTTTGPDSRTLERHRLSAGRLSAWTLKRVDA